MTSLDLVIMLPIALAVIRGYRKGFIIEVATFVGLILAIMLSMKLMNVVMEFLAPLLKNSAWLPFASYLGAFLLVFLLVLWIGKLLEKFVELAQLGFINRLAGAALSVLKTCFMISLVIWLADRIQAIPREVQDKSFMYGLLSGFAPKMIALISAHLPFLKNMVHDIEQYFTRLNTPEA